ncbi:MAG: putative lysine decarboxylase family protein [Burkholderiaceae bacterium]|nr:putative lysine decarboxylase family protein [Burkholderiaceae bacterium]
MKSLCVYCGSSFGHSPVHAAVARALAAELVGSGIALVYGGGDIGLMGVVADEVMRLGGEATGVIPKALMEKEVGHMGLTRLHIVKDMHERKAMMMELSDGFIALPGGLGTLEELFEVLTWAQLGYHAKPVGVLNAQGFFDGLIGFVSHQVSQGFVQQAHADLMLVETEPAGLLQRFREFYARGAVLPPKV